jgi:hypothetical protein
MKNKSEQLLDSRPITEKYTDSLKSKDVGYVVAVLADNGEMDVCSNLQESTIMEIAKALIEGVNDKNREK